MFCNKCGAQVPDGQAFCSVCGAPVNVQQGGYVPPVRTETFDQAKLDKVDKYREYYKLISLFWIIMGILLIISCVGLIAGIYNLIIGIKDNKFTPTIVAHNPQVVQTAKSMGSQNITTILINVFLGGGVGAIAGLLEMYVRNQIIKDRDLFEE